MNATIKTFFFIFGIAALFNQPMGFSDSPLGAWIPIHATENNQSQGASSQINATVNSSLELPLGLTPFLNDPQNLFSFNLTGEKKCSEQKDRYLYHQTCEVNTSGNLSLRWDVDREMAGSEVKSQIQIETIDSKQNMIEVISIRIKTAYKTASHKSKDREWIDVVTRPREGKVIRELITVDYKTDGQISKITLSIYEQIEKSELAKLLYYIRSAYNSDHKALQVRISNLTPEAYENRLFDWHHSRPKVSQDLIQAANDLSQWLFQKSLALLSLQKVLLN